MSTAVVLICLGMFEEDLSSEVTTASDLIYDVKL